MLRMIVTLYGYTPICLCDPDIQSGHPAILPGARLGCGVSMPSSESYAGSNDMQVAHREHAGMRGWGGVIALLLP